MGGKKQSKKAKLVKCLIESRFHDLELKINLNYINEVIILMINKKKYLFDE